MGQYKKGHIPWNAGISKYGKDEIGIIPKWSSVSKEEYGKAYYKKNRENLLKQMKEYRELNKDKISENRKKSYELNKDKYVCRSRENRKNNREKINKLQRIWAKKDPIRYKAYRISRIATGKVKKCDLQKLYEENIKKYGTLTCVLCNKSIVFGNDTIEHLIPISRGGTNEFGNLAVAHKSCNCSKQDKTVEEYKKFVDAMKAGE